MTIPLSQRFAWSKPATISLSLALIIGLGVLDYATGREVIISPFYLLPICWASWVVGRRAGLLLAIASAGVWLVADAMERQASPLRAIPYWNALMLLVMFLVVVYLLTAFHEAHVHLEGTVARRTAALRDEMAERKRLEIGKRRAERLAVVGAMAAEMAHEIKNPLGSIVLNLDLIQKEAAKMGLTSQHTPKESGVLLDEIRAEIRRIQRVLEDYLQFARLANLRRQPVVLNEWLDQKLAFLKGEFEQAGVTLRTRFDPALNTVNADADHLWQAILNLIRNGLEATPTGGELTVSTQRDETQMVLRVSDTGEGMTEGQIEQVFAPFFTTKPNGTGLGLALVLRIMLEHGGQVQCDSALGKGSTFTLLLPLTEKS